MDSFNTAEVYILDLPYSADIGYSYRIDPSMRDKIKVGSFVCVPFGRSNKLSAGLVGRLYQNTDRGNCQIYSKSISREGKGDI